MSFFKQKTVTEYLYIPIMIILFWGYIFIHCYKIEAIPFGINVDEMGMAYDAWCLKNYGVDRYLKSYPVYLTNFGGGQSALYAYLCAGILYFTDFSVLAIRLPGIFLSTISVVYGIRIFYLIEDFPRVKAFLYLFFVTIMPVYILLFRIGMDCNLMLAVAGIFIYYFVKAIYTSKSIYFIITGIFAGILLYTYAIVYFILPIFLLLELSYLLFLRKIHLVDILKLSIPLAVLAFPLILVQIINIFNLPEIQLGPITITKLIYYRSGEMKLSNISLESVKECIKSIFMYDWLRYNTIPKFGTIYYFSIPIILVGIIQKVICIIKKLKIKNFEIGMIYVVWFMLFLICGCCMEANTNRLNGIFISLIYFLVEGIVTIISWFSEAKLKYIVSLVIIIVYLGVFGHFCLYYFGGDYQEDTEPLYCFAYSLKEPIDYIENSEKFKIRKTYISNIRQTYIYFLGAQQISPIEYNQIHNGNKQGEWLGKWASYYQNYIFYLPKEIEYNSNYIIDKYDEEYCKKLEKIGFTKYEMKYYNVYTYIQ